MKIFLFSVFILNLLALSEGTSASSTSLHPAIAIGLWKKSGSPFSLTSSDVSEGSTSASRAHSKYENYYHPLIFALKNSNTHLLPSLVESVSSPSSSSYGEYFSLNKISDVFGASDQTIQSITNKLNSLNAKNIKVSATRDWIECSLPVSHLSNYFKVELHEYTHSESGRTIIRSPTHYFMPDELKEKVDLVLGISNFPVPRKSLWFPYGINPFSSSNNNINEYKESSGPMTTKAARRLMKNMKNSFRLEDSNTTTAAPTTPVPTTDSPTTAQATTVSTTTSTPSTNNLTSSTPTTSTTSTPSTSSPTTSTPSTASTTQSVTTTSQPTTTSLPTTTTVSGSNTPMLYQSYGSHIPKSISVSYVLFCSDGSVPITDSGACQGSVNISSVTIIATPTIPNQINITTSFPITKAGCSVNSNQYQCLTRILNNQYYVPYSILIQAVYSDGTTSSFGITPSICVITPLITPQQVYSLYGLPSHPSISKANFPTLSQSVVEFEMQFYSNADLIEFGESFGLPNSAVLPSYVNLVGYNDETNPGAEAELDIQWIMAMAPGAMTTFWSLNSTASQTALQVDDILAWTMAMNSLAKPILVNSISYGQPEDSVDIYQGQGYLARSDIEFAKLALRGVTIVIASGDTGSSDLGLFDFINCGKTNGDWPSQSPYVLSVGATYISPYADPLCFASNPTPGIIDCSANPLGEIVTAIPTGIFFTSGGGFSNTTQRPSYQDQAITQYLNRYPSAQPSDNTVWNRRGRGYPDLAAVGHNLLVDIGGVLSPIDGTSASAPIVSGIITLLNDIRINNGLPVLGFINPILYKIAETYPNAFNDVLVGSTECGATGDLYTVAQCCPFGYRATPGWDAASGLGSMNYAVLQTAIIDIITRTPTNTSISTPTPTNSNNNNNNNNNLNSGSSSSSGLSTESILIIGIGGGAVLLLFIILLIVIKSKCDNNKSHSDGTINEMARRQFNDNPIYA